MFEKVKVLETEEKNPALSFTLKQSETRFFD